MAHHSSRPVRTESPFNQAMELAAQQLRLGATQRMPLPPVTDDDEGEIQLAISADPERRKVFLNFGKPVAWVGFSPEQARDLGESLLAASLKVRGIDS